MDPYFGQYRPGKGSDESSNGRPPFPPYPLPPFPYGMSGPPPIHSSQSHGFPGNMSFPPIRPGSAIGNHFPSGPPFFPPPFPPHFPIPPPGHPVVPPPGFLQKSITTPSCNYQDLQKSLNLKDSELDEVKVLLNRVLDRCNQSDMALAKKWIVEHCKASDALRHLFKDLREAASLSQGEAPLRALYLANDLLFHDKRFQDGWVQTGLQPHLPSLVRLAALSYSKTRLAATNNSLRKLLDIWDSQNCLKPDEIRILQEILATAEATSPSQFIPPPLPKHPLGFPPLPFPGPPPHPPGVRPIINRPPFNIPRPPIVSAIVPYHKVPAGVMVLLCENATTSYSSIPIRSAQAVPVLPPSASNDLKEAIDDFYNSLEDDPEKIDSNGWQVGYLDAWCEARKEKLLPPTPPEHSRSRSSSRSRSNRSYQSRSRSPNRSRSSSRSRSPNRPRCRSSSRYRSSSSRSRSHYRSRSSSRSSSRSPSRSRRRFSSRHTSPVKRFYH